MRLSYDSSGSSLTVEDEGIFKINSDDKITVETSMFDGEEKELYLYSEDATNGKKWARKVKITGTTGCNIEDFKTFVTETYKMFSYRYKQNMPNEETV